MAERKSAPLPDHGRAEPPAEVPHWHLDRAVWQPVAALAGRLAHDLNNLIGIQLGHVEALQDELAPRHVGQQRLAILSRLVVRQTDLTGRLLVISGRALQSPRTIRLEEWYAENASALVALAGPHVRLHAAVQPSAGPVQADPRALQAAAEALIRNAVDAIARAGCGGTIRLELGSDDGAATMQVADDGPGLAPEWLPRAWEPFAGTRPDRPGLGLTEVAGLTLGGGGAMTITSGQGPKHGTRVTLRWGRVAGETG